MLSELSNISATAFFKKNPVFLDVTHYLLFLMHQWQFEV